MVYESNKGILEFMNIFMIPARLSQKFTTKTQKSSSN